MSTKTEQEINAEKASKPAIDVTPPELMFAAGRALGYGKAKHGVATPDGWGTWRVAGTQQAEPLTHYSCLMRHLLQWRAGEERDAESGLSHLDHAAAQLAILLDLLARPVESAIGKAAAKAAFETGKIKDPHNDADWLLPDGWTWEPLDDVWEAVSNNGGQVSLCFPNCRLCANRPDIFGIVEARAGAKRGQ